MAWARKAITSLQQRFPTRDLAAPEHPKNEKGERNQNAKVRSGSSEFQREPIDPPLLPYSLRFDATSCFGAAGAGCHGFSDFLQPATGLRPALSLLSGQNGLRKASVKS